MAKTVEVTIKARVRVPDAWRLKDLSIDKNISIPMNHTEIIGYSVCTTPFQPHVLTISQSIKGES